MVTEQKSPQVQEETPLYVKEYTAIDESILTESYYDVRAKEIGIRERIEFLDFRKEWSRNLLWLVIFIVAFNAVFLIAIGMRWLTFEDEWLVRIIFLGSFIEVLGLAKIVVEFLFAEHDPLTGKKIHPKN